MAVVESTKAASDVYAPLAGSVVAVNDALGSAPELVNSDPYGGGWLVRLKPADAGSLTGLMDAKAYEGFLAESDA
jgi:glycine cleavage system H protein